MAKEKRWIWLSSFSTYLVVAVFAISLTVLWVIWVFFAPAPYCGKGEVEIEIPSGFSFRQIAQLLYQHQLIPNPTSFLWAGRILGMEKKVMAGTYLIPLGKSNLNVLRALSHAMPTYRRITVPEGYTIFQIAQLLNRELRMDSVEFIKWCTDSTFAQELGVSAPSLEGYLFPDTYFISLQMSPPTVIKKMVNNFHHRVDSLLREEFHRSGLSLHQGITLASIIQGEMVYFKEARLISAVFHNRLKRRMPLEADPTIQYLIPEPPRRILL
ncbi:MAG: endolytic transglycosylase MltG, partial [bacterium]